MKKTHFFLIFLLIMLIVPLGAGAAILDELPLEKGATGQSVVMVQQRLIDLGYLHFRPTGSYGDMTKSAVASFQARNGISSTGVFGENTFSKLYSRGLMRTAGNPGIPRVIGPGGQGKPEPGELAKWQEGNSVFTVGQTAIVMDYKTQKTYQVRRTGGENHANAVFAEAQGEQVFLSCFGGSYTWEKRPAIVEVGATRPGKSIFTFSRAALIWAAFRMPSTTAMSIRRRRQAHEDDQADCAAKAQ